MDVVFRKVIEYYGGHLQCHTNSNTAHTIETICLSYSPCSVTDALLVYVREDIDFDIGSDFLFINLQAGRVVMTFNNLGGLLDNMVLRSTRSGCCFRIEFSRCSSITLNELL